MTNENNISQANTKRIAKNAVALYIRMIITMLVGFYTSRVVLQALGVTDYGIYNVVGGFVSFFSLISSSLQGSVSRFLTYELGTGQWERLRVVFSSSFYVLCGLSLLVVIVAETAGLWYLYNKMVIPEERLEAAFWVFQISIVTFVLNLVSTPYSASIISHEKMNIYAYMSIFDVTCKLLICYAVMVASFDKLIFYAFLLCMVGVLDQIIYLFYCRTKFDECKIRMIFERSLFKQMFGFAGWNFIGSSAVVLRGQGATLVINAFAGPAVNAANGIANTISGVVAAFVGNFTQAFTPQITKSYAAKQYDDLMKLLIYGSKYSYYLMFILALPVMLNADFIFQIWLGIVPEHTVAFSRWILIFLLSDTLARPIITAKNAEGNLRNYQLIVGGVQLIMIPLAIVFLKLGAPIEAVPMTIALTNIFSVFVRIYMLRGAFPSWSSKLFIRDVVLNVTYTSFLSIIIPYIVFCNIPTGWINFFATSGVSLISTIIVVYFVGCTKVERIIIRNKVISAIESLKLKLR